MRKFLEKVFSTFGWYPVSDRHHRQTIEKISVLQKVVNTHPVSTHEVHKAANRKMLELIEGMN
ncbi:ferritin-like metal-binding protein YciE [Siphonobacter sp. SORGH_AS 1065]|nr:ferritin-like metal-binding protein YciE [Siphonobacter sp. SORGH_AS_1065]